MNLRVRTVIDGAISSVFGPSQIYKKQRIIYLCQITFGRKLFGQLVSEKQGWSDVSHDEAVGDHLWLDVLTETTDTHGNNGVVLGVWLPGTASDLLASTAALPDADG